MSSYETCKMLALRGYHKKNLLFQNQPTYGHDAKQEQKMDLFLNIDIKNRKLQLYDYLYNFEIKFVETIIKNKC